MFTICPYGSHTKMLHLHYVECLLRALGEPPSFSLPNRNAEGDWIIPNWKAKTGKTEKVGEKKSE